LSVSYFCLLIFFPLLSNGCLVSIFSSAILLLFLNSYSARLLRGGRRYSICGSSHHQPSSEPTSESVGSALDGEQVPACTVPLRLNLSLAVPLRATGRQILKYHRCLIRTGLSSCIAHLIRKGAGRRATDFIGVETVVPGANDQRAVAVNVDPIRSRAAPRQVRCPFPTY
jgi:hypothetical protein